MTPKSEGELEEAWLRQAHEEAEYESGYSAGAKAVQALDDQSSDFIRGFFIGVMETTSQVTRPPLRGKP